jgi:hypothetical protein
VMLREVGRERRWKDLGLAAVGTVVGAILYVAVIGPWLLPY